jgi:hypothetical protein
MPEAVRTSTIAKLQESIQSLSKRLHRQESRTRAVGLLEGANREVTEVRVKALMAAATPKARKSLIESWAEKPRDYRSRSAASRASQDSDVRPYPQTNPFLKAGQ